jgi:non-heme Fe2+,alpha-ketoglutarate-dependent halogenase
VTSIDDYVAAFQREGFVSGIRVRSLDQAEVIRRWWNELEAEEQFSAGGYSTTHSRHLDQRVVWDLASDPLVLDHLEPLIGPDILLFGSRFFCKYGPDVHHKVSWHQDLDSWGLEPPVALTVWYAVDRSDERNGCVRVIPGSHHAPALRDHGLSTDDGNMLGRGQHLELDQAELTRSKPLVLDMGEISIHDGALVHASMPNTSDTRRCGLAIRYVPCHVRQRVDLAKSPLAAAILVRGEDRYQHFGSHRRPFD